MGRGFPTLLFLTFLSPIPAIIAAAVTIPALVVFYLLKLRRRPVRVSSTLLWQQATRDLQVNVPLRWLRPTWIFLLQLLILCLFLLALARPAVNMAGTPPSKVALLIDRSASMSARDGAEGRTRLAEAKERAEAVLEEIARRSPGTAVAVIGFAAQPRLHTGFTTDRGAVRAAIGAIGPTDQPGDVGAAIGLAAAVLASDAGEEGPRRRTEVVLLSDGGSATREGYTLPGAEFRYERIGPLGGGAGGGATGAAGGGAAERPVGRDNLGIVALAARREWEDPASVRVFARIQNAAAAPTAANISLMFNGRVVQTRPLVLPGAGAGGAAPAGGGEGEQPAAGPAEFPVTFRLETREGGLVELRIERPDLLDADNSAAVVLAAAAKPRIWVVVPDAAPAAEGESPGREPHWLITSIIQEAGLPLRIVPASAYERDVGAGVVAADLVIFDRVRPLGVPPAPSVSFGAGLPLPGLDAPAEPLEQGTYFLSWQRTHPLLRHVALDTIYVSRPLRLEPPEEGGGVVELARGASGPLMLLGEPGGVRRVVVGFALADSTWPLHAGFTIFVASAVDYLTMRGEDNAGRAFTTDRPARVVYAGPRGVVTLRGPVTITADAPEGSGARAVALGTIERAGVYRLDGAGPDAPEREIAVNLLDPGESALGVREAVRVGGDAVEGRAGAGEGPRELWPWLVLAALVLLSGEWVLNAWLMRA